MYKIQNRVMLSRYRGRTLCSDCKGKRLRKEASYVKINGLSITDLVDMPISKLLDFQKKCPYDRRCHEKCMTPHFDVILMQIAHFLIDFGPLLGADATVL